MIQEVGHLAGRSLADLGACRDRCEAAALDVRDGAAVGEGWRSGAAGLPVYPALARLLDAGTTWIAVTSIAPDGTMDRLDIALLKAARRLAPDVRLLGFGGVWLGPCKLGHAGPKLDHTHC